MVTTYDWGADQWLELHQGDYGDQGGQGDQAVRRTVSLKSLGAPENLDVDSLRGQERNSDSQENGEVLDVNQNRVLFHIKLIPLDQ